MRRLDTSDFEASNIEYITFWMLDPFIYDDAGNNVGEGNSTAKGGDLYINLGDLSEDILKDGRKSFENGLSPDGDTTQTDETVWGRVSRERSITYAFDSDTRSRRNQDVGLDGLPKADVLKYLLEDNCSVVVRPSGTEPKLKTYISVSAETREAAQNLEAQIARSLDGYFA